MLHFPTKKGSGTEAEKHVTCPAPASKSHKVLVLACSSHIQKDVLSAKPFSPSMKSSGTYSGYYIVRQARKIGTSA